MPDLSELYQTVGGVLAADATLGALLANAQQVYQESPAAHAQFPCVTLRMRHTNPVRDVTGRGAYRPVWEISVWAADADRLRAVEIRLNELLDVPRTVSDGLAGATWRIKELAQVDSYDGPPFAMASTAEQIQRLVTIWNSFVVPLS